MPRRGKHERARLAGTALALLTVACRPAPAPSLMDAGPAARATAPPQTPFSLPPEWVVSTGADGVVKASSPRGKPVLRAEVQRGLGLPTPATLRSGFLGGLHHLRERSDSVAEAPGFIAMRFLLAEPDGGTADTEALLSATAIGEDTFLCASLPGATHEELDVVQAACQSAGAPARR